MRRVRGVQGVWGSVEPHRRRGGAAERRGQEVEVKKLKVSDINYVIQLVFLTDVFQHATLSSVFELLQQVIYQNVQLLLDIQAMTFNISAIYAFSAVLLCLTFFLIENE